MKTPLESALEYAARGWRVLPLRPGSKIPATAHGVHDATTEAETIRAWWSAVPEYNVGVATGPESGIVVVDIDRHGETDGEKSAADLPATYTVTTPNAGRHLYYQHPNPGLPIKSRVGVRPGIDLKSAGGYVVAPPSRLNGRPDAYAYVSGELLMPAPLSLLSTDKPLTHDPAPSGGGRAPTEKYGQIALKLESRAVRQSTPNENRNDTLNRASFNLGQLVGAGSIERATVESELAAAAAAVGLGQAEAESTIRSGLDAGTLEPREAPKKRAEPILIPGPHRDTSDVYTEQSGPMFTAAAIGALPENTVYRRANIPGELLGQPGVRRFSELTHDRTRLIIDEHAKLAAWYTKAGEQIIVYKPCARDHAGLVMAAAQQDARIRDIDALVGYPIYGPGFVRVTPGWHDGVYYDEPPDLADLTPCRDTARIAEEFHELLIDFPFKDEASRQNFMGLMLTPLVAPAIDGNRPMHLLLSPLERTGKTKLAEDVLGGVILGRPTPAMQITDRDDERDKRILALLLQGETIVHLDNLPPTVEGGSLASMLTATTYQGRILGASRVVSLPNTLTVVGSGNNTECSAEIVKRTIPIMLQPDTPHPERRRKFLHPNLRAHVAESRRHILAALIGMVENWIAAGKPKHENRFGGFEAWSETIGGILHANGFRDWRSNENEWRAAADPESQQWEGFIKSWWEAFGDGPVAPGVLLHMAEDDDLLSEVITQRTARGRQTAFGRRLRKQSGRPVGTWRILRGTSGNNPSYRLERTSV